MTQSTSSAEYLKLYHYSDAALQLDSSLVVEANRLRGALLHFEATCREPAFRQSVSHVADGMVMYGARAAVVDAWVRVVGLGFQAADGGGLAALLPSWLPPWMVGLPLWPPVRWPVDPGFIIGPRPRPQPLLPIWPPYGWWLPPWIGRLPWLLPWLPPDLRRIEIPEQPASPVIQLPQEPRIIIDDPRPKMLHPILDSPTGSGSTGEDGQNTNPGERKLTLLSQLFPEETDPELLNARRYENAALKIEHVSWLRDGTADTVREHIAAYGCRMTCLVMLLRDLGQKNVTISKLYRATYNKKRTDGKTIEEDLARDDNDNTTDRDIVYGNLYPDAGDDAVDVVSDDKYEVKPLPKLTNTTDALKEALKSGPVIVRTIQGNVDGHWIIIDSYDTTTGTFSIRNPNKPVEKVQASGVKIPGDFSLQGDAIRVVPKQK